MLLILNSLKKEDRKKLPDGIIQRRSAYTQLTMRRRSVTGLAEVTSNPTGLHGLVKNKKCLGLAMFASLGGVLYGYNQVTLYKMLSSVVVRY